MPVLTKTQVQDWVKSNSALKGCSIAPENMVTIALYASIHKASCKHPSSILCSDNHRGCQLVKDSCVQHKDTVLQAHRCIDAISFICTANNCSAHCHVAPKLLRYPTGIGYLCQSLVQAIHAEEMACCRNGCTTAKLSDCATYLGLTHWRWESLAPLLLLPATLQLRGRVRMELCDYTGAAEDLRRLCRAAGAARHCQVLHRPDWRCLCRHCKSWLLGPWPGW